MNLGEIRQRIFRTSGYNAILNTIMLVYIALSTKGLETITIIAIYGFLFLLFLVISELDKKHILPKEQKFLTDNNPYFVELMARVKEIERK